MRVHNLGPWGAGCLRNALSGVGLCFADSSSMNPLNPSNLLQDDVIYSQYLNYGASNESKVDEAKLDTKTDDTKTSSDETKSPEPTTSANQPKPTQQTSQESRKIANADPSVAQRRANLNRRVSKGYVKEPAKSLLLAGRASLRRGHRGEQVQTLQQKLNAAGITPKLAEDGLLGPKTQKAIMDFQKK